jgi:glutathione reductase (NADPH)
LRGFDLDLREDLTVAMGMRGVRVLTGRTFKSIEKSAKHLRGILSDGGVVEADHIMFAIGRRPNTHGLGLKAAGVAVGAGGEIKVDVWSKTSVDNIYAVGDITDRVKLTPVAIREGQAFADTVFGGKPWSVEHAMIPTAVFSEPEIGTVGLSETAARERVGAVDIYKMRFRPLKHTLSGRDEQMLMKLVVDQRSERVLGCHVLGADAAEIVQMAAVAMRMGATKADFDATVALHPTAGEELVTMRDKWVPLAAE